MGLLLTELGSFILGDDYSIGSVTGFYVRPHWRTYNIRRVGRVS